MAALEVLAAAATAPEPAAPPELEGLDRQAVARQGLETELLHPGLPARSVPGPDAGDQVAELMEQGWHELLRMAREQVRIELDCPPGFVRPSEGCSQLPAVVHSHFDARTTDSPQDPSAVPAQSRR